MKNLVSTIKTLAFASVMTISAYAQTADEIINKYIENIGGKEKLGKLTSTTMVGDTEIQGMKMSMTQYSDKDGKMSTKVNFQGQDFVVFKFDGENGFAFNQMKMALEPLPAESNENLKNTTKFEYPDPFLNYKDKGFKAELVGKETVEGTQCFKIKLIKKPMKREGKIEENFVFYYFDAENYIPIVMEQTITEGPAKGQTVKSKFGEYQDVSGLMLPFYVEGDMGAAKVKEYKLNQPVPAELAKK